MFSMEHAYAHYFPSRRSQKMLVITRFTPTLFGERIELKVRGREHAKRLALAYGVRPTQRWNF